MVKFLVFRARLQLDLCAVAEHGDKQSKSEWLKWSCVVKYLVFKAHLQLDFSSAAEHVDKQSKSEWLTWSCVVQVYGEFIGRDVAQHLKNDPLSPVSKELTAEEGGRAAAQGA